MHECGAGESKSHSQCACVVHELVRHQVGEHVGQHGEHHGEHHVSRQSDVAPVLQQSHQETQLTSLQRSEHNANTDKMWGCFVRSFNIPQALVLLRVI